MKSKNINYLPKLDHLRFLAAFLVIVYHYYHFHTGFYNGFKNPAVLSRSPGSALVIDGHVGVSLFLVLSGFIFAAIAYGQKLDYVGFVGNRLLRIMPLYATAIGIACLLSPPTLSQLVASLSFASSFVSGVNDVRITPHLWTIALEFQFYLLFPFLINFVERYGLRYVVGAIVMLIAFRFLMWCSTDLVSLKSVSYRSLVGRLDQFLLGMVAGIIYSGRSAVRVPRWLVSAWSPLVAAVLSVLLVWGFHRLGGFYHLGDKHWLWIFWTPIEGLIWAFLILAYCASSFELFSWLSRSLSFLGSLSFSLYVNHWVFVHDIPFHRWLPRLSESLPLNALLAVILVIIPPLVLFSWLTYSIIEKPFFELRRSYIKKSQ